MHCLHMVLEMIQAGQKVSQMLALRVTTNKARCRRLMPQVDVLDVVHHVGNALKVRMRSAYGSCSFPTQYMHCVLPKTRGISLIFGAGCSSLGELSRLLVSLALDDRGGRTSRRAARRTNMSIAETFRSVISCRLRSTLKSHMIDDT